MSRGRGQRLTKSRNVRVHSSNVWLRWALTVAAALGLSVKVGAVPSVEYDPAAGRVSLSAQNEPMEAVLVALADAVGCVLTARADLSRPITTRVNQAPLPRALDRVLTDYDYVLLYRDGRPAELKVYSTAALAATGGAPGQGMRPRGPARANSATRADGGPRLRNNASPLTRADSSRLEKARELKRIQQADNPGDVDTLIAALDTVDSAGMRMGVMRALGEAGDARAVEPLTAILASSEVSSPEKVAAVRALGLIDAEEARAALAKIAEGSDMAAKVAAQTLNAP